MNIISDIAGQYDALMRLVKMMPQNEPILLLGDLVDRGPDSDKVVEWAMKTPNVKTLMGNHEHMMIDYYSETGLYDDGIWEWNGGSATKLSYDNTNYNLEEHLTFLRSLPAYYEEDGLFCSHAAKLKNYSLELQLDTLRDEWTSIIWNRNAPSKIKGTFQVMGHNSHWGLMKFDNWGICLDATRSKVITGMHWPTKEIFQAPYLNSDVKK